MNDKDRDKWIESMAKEMEGLHDKGMYELIDCEEAQKSGCHIVPTIWAFRQKCLVDGTPTQKKSHVVLCGDLQKDLPDDCNITYAPVIGWSTLCLLLNLTLHEGWKTKQVDCI
jgi:hypothetical protein